MYLDSVSETDRVMASVERTPTCTSVSMPKDGRLYVPLDVNFVDEYEHMSSDAIRLFIELLSFGKRIANRGYFSSANVRRATSLIEPTTPLRELFDAGLIGEAEIEQNGASASRFSSPLLPRGMNLIKRSRKQGRKGGVASGYTRRERSCAKQKQVKLQAETKQVVEQVEKSREEKSKENS